MTAALRLKMVDGVPFLRVRNAERKLIDFYAGQHSGPLPTWVTHDVEQVKHFLELGLWETCDDLGVPTDPGRVWECLSAMSDIPEDAGAPRVREALREQGLRFSNETICKAIALRKSSLKYGEDTAS